MSTRLLSDINKVLKRATITEEEINCLHEVLSVAQVVVSSLDLDEVLQNILCSAMGIVDVPAGSIALYDETTSSLELHAHLGLSAEFTAKNRWKVKKGGLTYRILDAGEFFIVEDTAGESFFNNPLAVAEGIRSLVAVPLTIQEKIIGILYLNDFKPRLFDPMRLHMLSILGSFATMSIDNARLHAQAQILASTDGLTGLYNHRQFISFFSEESTRAARYGKPLSLIMLDVDDFKKFNDAYGHPLGDKALISVARTMRASLRGCDLSFRYGGEEFVAILPETDLESALVAAERIRAMVLEESRVALADTAPHGVTVSVGVATYPRDGVGDDLLKAVDDQLYRAKREGKNRVYFRNVEE